MDTPKRHREIFGIVLALVGLLFLLVNNGLMWFGWGAIWPAFPLLIGVFVLKLYATGRKPEQLFFGLLATGLGIFFFLFSSGAMSWGAMGTLWPVILLLVGIALLALSASGDRPLPALVVGLAVVIGGVFGFLATTGVLGARVLVPIVRLWPLVLIAAGALVFYQARQDRLEAVAMDRRARQDRLEAAVMGHTREPDSKPVSGDVSDREI
ncbi:MAG: hypothetical protein JSW58_11645 [Candidatus Latescibacterota bacterium]|nr:MAG: hypothetical protein JSW58_11645 [Candidatus Latescibacterota bacterium]